MMKKFVLVFCVATLIFAVNVKAVETTIFETFNTDPTLGSWTSTTSNSSFDYKDDLTGVGAYVGGGYLFADPRRSPNSDRYSVPLAQAYDQTQEFWMEVDIEAKSSYIYQRGLFGLFDSTSDNKTNYIGTTFHRGSGNNSTALRNFMSLTYSDAGVAKAMISTSSPYVFALEEPIRVKVHYSYDGGTTIGTIEFQTYRLNLLGAGDDVLLSNVTGYTAVTAGTTLTYDSFGIGGTYGTASNSAPRSWMDNFYFSTVQANPTYIDPAFIPEPATIAMLSLGGLLLRRRRK